MEYENNTFTIKESPFPIFAHVQPRRQITKSPYTNNTTRSKLIFNWANVEVWEWMSNFIPHFKIDIIIYPRDKQHKSIKPYLAEYNLGPFTDLD